MSISGNVSCSGNQHMIARECDSAHVQPQGRLCLRLLYQLIYISCSEKRRLGAGNLSTVSASLSESAGFRQFRSPLPEYSSIVRAHYFCDSSNQSSISLRLTYLIIYGFLLIVLIPRQIFFTLVQSCTEPKRIMRFLYN